MDKVAISTSPGETKQTTEAEEEKKGPAADDDDDVFEEVLGSSSKPSAAASEGADQAQAQSKPVQQNIGAKQKDDRLQVIIDDPYIAEFESDLKLR